VKKHSPLSKKDRKKEEEEEEEEEEEGEREREGRRDSCNCKIIHPCLSFRNVD
jgi:hypothetical protein